MTEESIFKYIVYQFSATEYMTIIISINTLLWEMDTIPGAAIVNTVFVSLLKGVNTKRKEFAPCGSKFFPFRADPFSEWDWWAGK